MERARAWNNKLQRHKRQVISIALLDREVAHEVDALAVTLDVANFAVV